MTEKHHKQFPHNRPYIENIKADQTSSRSLKNIKAIESCNNSPSMMSASALAERVQYLEEQLVNLASALSDESK